jgi:hypothetical protein
MALAAKLIAKEFQGAPAPTKFRVHLSKKGFSPSDCDFLLSVVKNFSETHHFPSCNKDWDEVAKLFNNDDVMIKFCELNNVMPAAICGLRTPATLCAKYPKIIAGL